MRQLAMVSILVLGGCSGGGDLDGGSPGMPAPVRSPSDPPSEPTTRLAPSATPTLYGACDAANVALSAGSYTESTSGVTFAWPDGWTGAKESNVFGLQKSYAYVPTGRTEAQTTAARVHVFDPFTYAEAADVETRLASLASAYSHEHVERITLGGYPALFAWGVEAPPQPGCAGANCVLDPGPDLVWIRLGVGLGLRFIEAQASARVNAEPSDVLCEMQAILIRAVLP
jgi:hypothetical protein